MEVQFSSENLLILNVILAFMMFGVSLSLTGEDFRRVLKRPDAPIVGLLAQFVLLPAATCLTTWFFEVEPEMALGMILVASCPGGSFSNIMTWLARANVAVSVSMTAISSLVAMVMTPFNFALYGWLNPHTRSMLTEIQLDSMNILILVALVLGLPLLVGMMTGKLFPRFAARAEKPMRVITLLVLLLFVGVAFGNNMDVFLATADRIVILVVLQNLLALGMGAFAGGLTGLPRQDRRAITMEVGIQNSGLGLAILFTFFPEASGMILIAAFWGVWHLVSGLLLAWWWSRGHDDRQNREGAPCDDAS
ncbi:MAG: bile acid:sodium symporter family protein [Alcanivorax sp.]|uniref:bile acid:sodium symporter family protein n=1 Tax=Alcanivorax sp. TaxID=1872427 RepID=UPI0019867F41|nr:bile acid:sodium symporter family protein [Alcanivorax sp.]MBD3643851.1 bile acid:sodium symporter family protein [Alcanivorax sp.]MDF1725936.1 bile acid:sodium symporter family protein [Alcanivorax sp.]